MSISEHKSIGKHSLSLAPEGARGRYGALGVVIALALVGAPAASACGWRMCGDGPYGYRPAPRAYSYRSPPRAYRYRSPTWAYGYRGAAWAHGYTSPARVYGYAYAAWPSTSIPPTRSYLNTATPVPNAAAVGLTAPITSAEGLRESGLPPRGPSLFGPSPPPPAWGYYYGPYAPPSYGYRPGPAYAYRPYSGPPPDTPSWWAEPRRRR